MAKIIWKCVIYASQLITVRGHYRSWTIGKCSSLKRVLYTLLYRQRGTKAKMKSTTLKTKNSPWLLTMYKTWACVICRSSLWKLVLNTLGEEFLKNTFLDIRIHFWIFTFTAFVRYIFSEQYLYFLEVRVVIWFVV